MQGTPLTLFVHLTHSYGCASSAHAGEHRYTLAAEPRTLNKLDAELWGRRTRELTRELNAGLGCEPLADTLGLFHPSGSL
jgi:hypothetical protein